MIPYVRNHYPVRTLLSLKHEQLLALHNSRPIIGYTWVWAEKKAWAEKKHYISLEHEYRERATNFGDLRCVNLR